MSRVLLAVAIDDWGLGPLAAKEAAVMRLEPLGNVQVLRVKVEEDEQLGFVPSDSAMTASSGHAELICAQPLDMAVAQSTSGTRKERIR